MPDKTPLPTTPEADASSARRDLRTELQTDLKSEFTANLAEVGTLPKVVCESLMALLNTSSPTAADVIAALGLEDPIQPEVPNG
jgi:hypothetical protein